MAQVKNYGLIGVGASLQLGKQGPKLKGNADASLMQIVAEDNALAIFSDKFLPANR